MAISKEHVIEVLEHFGFKMYKEGDKEYFLQSRIKVKPMKKYSMEYMIDLFNVFDTKQNTVEKVVTKVKKGVKGKKNE